MDTLQHFGLSRKNQSRRKSRRGRQRLVLTFLSLAERIAELREAVSGAQMRGEITEREADAALAQLAGAGECVEIGRPALRG